MYSLKFLLDSEVKAYNFGKLISNIISHNFVIFLNGELGTGKTTISRGLIRGFLGNNFFVKSPTFSIVELYSKNNIYIYHIDLYRLKNFNDLVSIGFNDFFNKNYIIIFEWANKFLLNLPKPHLVINIYILNNGIRLLNLESNYINLKSLFS